MTATRARRRLPLAAAVVAACVLVAAPACSGDDGDGNGSASREDATTTTTTPQPTTTRPTDPAVYNETLDRLMAEVETARGDLCELRGIAEGASAAGTPTNGEQAKKAAEFIGVVYGALGEAAPDPKDGEIIRAAAAGMLAETEAPDFDLETFLEQGPTAFSDDEFRGAVQRVLAASEATCGRPTTTVG